MILLVRVRQNFTLNQYSLENNGKQEETNDLSQIICICEYVILLRTAKEKPQHACLVCGLHDSLGLHISLKKRSLLL